MKIVVLVKEVPDTWGDRKLDVDSGLLDRDGSDAVIDEICERAIEVSLRSKDADDSEVVLLSMGRASAKDILRKALAMGADSAVHVLDDSLAGSDMIRTSEVLAAAITRLSPDLVIAGNESTDGRGGMMAAMLAERLDLPQATNLQSVQITGSSVRGERFTDEATMTVRAPLPAIISITERNPEARFPSFKGIMKAKKKPLDVWSLAELGVAADSAQTSGGASSTVLSVVQRPARTGGKVVFDDGNAGAELAQFLAAGHLI